MARADLNVRLGVITRNFEKSLKRAERNLRRTAQQMSDIGSSLTTAVSLPIAGLGVASLRAAGDIEALEKGLEAVLPAGASAADELDRLRKIAELPGLGFEQAIQGSVRLQSVGFNADQSAASLEAFGRVVALTGGTAQQLDSVVNQFTQINSKGRLLAEDLNVIRENASGFNIALQAAFGTTNIEAIRATGISTGEFTRKVVEAIQQSEVFQNVQGGLSNSFENARIAVRLFLSRLGEQINKLFDVQGATERFSAALGRLGAAFKELDDEQKKNIIRFAAIAVAIGPAILAVSQFLTVLRVVPIVIGTLIGPFRVLSAVVLGAGKVFTAVAIRGKTLAVALRSVGASWLTAAAPVVGVIAGIAAVAGVFLFVTKNAEAFEARFTNIFIQIKTKVLEQINRLIDGLNPLLSAVGLEIDKAKIEPQQLVDEPKFQSFSEFIGSVKDDLVNLVPGLSSAASGFTKLKEAVFGGGDSAGTQDLGIEGAFDGFTGITGPSGPAAEVQLLEQAYADALKTSIRFRGVLRGINEDINAELQDAISSDDEQFKAISTSSSIAIKALSDLREEYKKIDTAAAVLGENTSFQDQQSIIAQKIRITRDALVEAAQKFGLNSLAVQTLREELSRLQGQLSEREDPLNLVNAFGLPREIVENVVKGFDDVRKGVSTVVAQSEQVLAAVALVRETITAPFEDFFTTLVEGGKNAFGQFAKTLGQTVKKIIADLLSAIAVAAVLALVLGPILGGGTFASQFGTLLKGGGGIGALVAGAFGLAEGGIIPPGYPNDTYLARLSSGEAVIPLNRLNSMLDSGGGQMVADTVIRGEDIVLSYNRASKTLGR